MSVIIDVHVALSQANAAFQSAALASVNATPDVANVFTVSGAPTILAARQQGLSQGIAEYVSWCDDDDTVTNMDVVASFLTTTQPDAVFTNSNIIDVNGVVQRPYFSSGFRYNKHQMFMGNQRPHQLVVVKRGIAEKAMAGVVACAAALGQTSTQSWPAEIAFYFEVALITDWVFFNKICYNWRTHASSQMHSTSPQYIGQILKYYQEKVKP